MNRYQRELLELGILAVALWVLLLYLVIAAT